MRYEYRVVRADELMATPSVWQSPWARVRQYAARLEEALNRMAGEGWRLVESHKEPWSGAIFLVFEREAGGSAGAQGSEGIRASLPGRPE